MKEKVFYVVNLDKKRITFLLMFLAGLLSSFFFLGVSVGKGNAMVQMHKANLPAPTTAEPTQPNPNPNNPSDTTIAFHSTKENQGTYPFANKAPQSSEEPTKTEIPNELPTTKSFQENIEQVETYHESQPNPPKVITNKHTPKRETTIDSLQDQTGNFTIQIAAFSNKEDAEKLVRKILSDNPNLKVKPYIRQSGKYYTVRLGRSNNKIALKNLLDTIHLQPQLKKSAYIIKYS